MSVTGNEEIFTSWVSQLDEAGATVICLCGELDATSAPSFLNDVCPYTNRRRNVILDVHLLSYADSTGVAAIISMRTAIETAGGGLFLVGCHGILNKILDTLGPTSRPPCFDDLDQAIEHFRVA